MVASLLLLAWKTDRSLEKECSRIEKKRGEFACLITRPDTGQISFVYNRRMLFEERFCPGSLIKPFTLLSYVASHPFDKDKTFNCKGFFHTKDRLCWLGEGHGRVDLVHAIAFSCNHYFMELIKDKLKKRSFLRTLAEFGIKEDMTTISDTDFFKTAVGLGPFFRVKPVHLLLAFNTLFNRGALYNIKGELISRIEYNSDVIECIREGMRGSYLYGTGKKIFDETKTKDMMCKTGTGMAFEKGKVDYKNTVGWVIVFFPSYEPTFSMLVLVRNGTGSEHASIIASEILDIVTEK